MRADDEFEEGFLRDVRRPHQAPVPIWWLTGRRLGSWSAVRSTRARVRTCPTWRVRSTLRYRRQSSTFVWGEQHAMSFKRLYGYETMAEAKHCAEVLQEEGIECVLRHRGKGLFGDAAMDELTWIDVPGEDIERAKELLWPEA